MKLHLSIATLGLVGVALVSACSGGGGGPSYAVPVTHTSSTDAPSTVASQSPSGSPLQTATIDGGPAFVTSSNLAVYVSSADGVDVSNCTGGCLAVWPAVIAPSGTLPSPFSSFVRSDNGEKQLAYNGQPLYTFSSDTPGTANGDGSEGFSLARPLASGATAAPTAAPTTVPTTVPTSIPSTAPTASSPTASPKPTSTPYNPY